ncbi:hypothetical protein BYT27DRAFT_7102540 [Phlegmacium glaucopus]|nr:hypothetical protein BYT27DRAFT_7102540 [Phlegmacium glaucopus]
MSAETHTYIEQDPILPPAGNELPTYDDLTQQNGPNSRFGRWKGWIEKRAAERYADITPEEQRRRRERGWGDTIQSPQQSARDLPQNLVNHHHPDLLPVPLHIQTSSLTVKDSPPHSPDNTSIFAPLPFAPQIISPSHLNINHFGSRFLPHTTSQIRCILPLLANRVILVGHDDGLSVLDMFPQEWTDQGELIVKGPNEAQCRPIWRGESLLQMSVLESEDAGNGTPQGVVLAVVGPSHDSPVFGRDAENIRTVRMYNLASLISLARWTITHEGAKPIELPKMATWQSPPSPSKRHRPQSSIARSIKSLIDSPMRDPSQPEPFSSYQPYLSGSSTIAASMSGGSFARNPLSPENLLAPLRRKSNDSEWDFVDDQTMRWATDYIPLAPAGSRLAGTSALLFATWSDEARKGRGTGGQLLAVATKSNVLLYETPKGERAFKFVKEFYTPLQARSVAFIQQALPDPAPRNLSEGASRRSYSHRPSDSVGALRIVVNNSTSYSTLSYGAHLSLFIAFDKKAVLIRLGDSAVGEVELADDDGAPQMSHISSRISTISTATLRTRARLSFDIRESIARWLVPVRCELPVPGQIGITQPVYILTRGKRTHIVLCPFPTRSPPTPPLHALFWKCNPKYISPRVIHTKDDSIDEPPLLQLVAFNDNGIEVQETTLTFLRNKGKGRALPDDLIRAEEDLGGEAGFLAVGGNWDQLDNLYGSSTPGSGQSVESMDSVDLIARMRRDEGVYGWCRKGFNDWRVFWVGGDRSAQDIDQDDDGFGM